MFHKRKTGMSQQPEHLAQLPRDAVVISLGPAGENSAPGSS